MRIPVIKLNDRCNSFINVSEIQHTKVFKGLNSLKIAFKGNDKGTLFEYDDIDILLRDIESIEEVINEANKSTLVFKDIPIINSNDGIRYL